MEKKRTNGLIVLCVLSWLYIGIEFTSVLIGLSTGPLTDEQIREEKLEILAGQTPETIEMMGGMIEEMVALLEVTQEHHYLINGLNAVAGIVGFFGVFMMFKLRKFGYHLYIVYCILEIGVSSYFFSQFSIGIAGAIFLTVFSGLFVLLYGLQLKYMD